MCTRLVLLFVSCRHIFTTTLRDIYATPSITLCACHAASALLNADRDFVLTVFVPAAQKIWPVRRRPLNVEQPLAGRQL